MQDILREKQNHIEQLMQERDLEKQDAGNQILSYQTSISQVCIYNRFCLGLDKQQVIFQSIIFILFCYVFI